jgi:hypothetical protein
VDLLGEALLLDGNKKIDNKQKAEAYASAFLLIQTKGF